jgi:hypothetical protein
VGAACSTHGKAEKYVQNIGRKIGNEETSWKIMAIEGRIRST